MTRYKFGREKIILKWIRVMLRADAEPQRSGLTDLARIQTVLMEVFKLFCLPLQANVGQRFKIRHERIPHRYKFVMQHHEKPQLE
jgi:hypothetical protein